MVKWVECSGCDQHGLSSKPICIILLCPWERHFMALSPALQSGQAVLNFSYISMTLKN